MNCFHGIKLYGFWFSNTCWAFLLQWLVMVFPCILLMVFILLWWFEHLVAWEWLIGTWFWLWKHYAPNIVDKMTMNVFG